MKMEKNGTVCMLCKLYTVTAFDRRVDAIKTVSKLQYDACPMQYCLYLRHVGHSNSSADEAWHIHHLLWYILKKCIGYFCLGDFILKLSILKQSPQLRLFTKHVIQKIATFWPILIFFS